MTLPTRACSDTSHLESYLREELSEAEEDAVQEHLGTCSDCQAALERIAGDPSLWTGLRDHLKDAPLDTESAPPQEAGLAELVEYLGPTDDPDMLGRLGNYEVCGLIGRGATGIVMKALEPRLNRYVAIKLMLPLYASHGAARRRFEREGRAIAAVSHEHVVPIYAVDDHRGLPYIVMKYIPGLSLQQRIERDGALDTCEAVRVGLQVAEGLAAAHAQGIVHRDVKPANVILEATVDRAMVTDFGLARVMDEASMTRSATISGTPQYMSPEQARGESVDPRSDLFSLGSLLYTACTARPPFRAETVFGVINRVCETEPRPIRETNPDVDEWLVAFIRKLMSKRPGDRFPSAAAVATELSSELAYLQNPTAAERPKREWLTEPKVASAGRRRPRALLAGALLAVAACVFAVVALSSGEGEPDDGNQVASMSHPSPWPAPPRVQAATPGLAELDGSADPGVGGNAGGAADPSVAADAGDSTPPALDLVPGASTGDPAAPALDLVAGADTDPGSGGPSPAVDAIRNPAVRPASVADPSLGVDPAPPLRSVSGAATLVDGAQVRWVRNDDDWNKSPTVTYDQKLERAFPVSGDGRLVVRADRGDVVVRPSELDRIHVTVLRRVVADHQEEAESLVSRHGVRFTATGDDLTIDARFAEDFTGPSVDDKFETILYRIGVPRGFAADVSTDAGNVTVGAVTGAVKVEAEAGDVSLAHLGGSLWVRATGGDIDLTDGCSGEAELCTINGDAFLANVMGTADVRASGGSIWLGESSGYVSAHASGGDVSVDGLAGPTDAHAAGGNVILRLVDDPVSDSYFSATSGDVTIAVAEDVAMSIRALGELEATFPVEWTGSYDGVGEPWSVSYFNGGGVTLRASSSSGTVALRRVDRADGLGGSGLGGSGLGGSGAAPGHSKRLSEYAREKTSGAPRAGALVTVTLPEPVGAVDGYTLYLPVTYDQGEAPYPVLVYLQGSYGVGGPIGEINNWGLPRLIRDESDTSTERNQLLLDGFIVVSPHIQQGQYHDETTGVTRILEDVFATYRADPRRVYLTGLSRGGHGTWGLASRLPDTFAAIVPVGASPHPVDDFGALASTSIWIAHNTGDLVTAFWAAEEAAQSIEEDGGVDFLRVDKDLVAESDYLDRKHVFSIGRAGGHDAWTDLYTSAELYKWLLRQELSVTRSVGGSRSGPRVRPTDSTER